MERSGDGYALTLKGVSQVIAFADRPQRFTLNLSAEEFVEGWDGWFEGDPPNAALDLVGFHSAGEVIVVEAPDRPVIEGDDLSFGYVVQHDDLPESLGHYDSVLLDEVPGRFGKASLFVDGAAIQEPICNYICYTPSPFRGKG